MIDKGVCDEEFIQNPSNCECECDRSCDIVEYLDYKNCKCREKLFDTLVQECTGNTEETKLTKNENKHEKECGSCTQYIVLFSLSLVLSIRFDIYFVYYKYINHNKYDHPY